MSQQGWVKLHRKMRECWLWTENEPFDKRSAWIDLLLSANHADKKTLINNKLTEVKRGSFITSEVKLSERWKWDRGKVRRFLKLLESDNMLKKETTSRLYITVTIINYDTYQGTTSESVENTSVKDIDTTSNEQEENKKKTSEEHVTNINKNDNNSNNDKEIDNNIENPKQSVKDTSIKDAINEQVEYVWGLYPKKKGRATAIKKIPKLIKDYGYEQLQRCIERYLLEINKNNTSIQYVKQGDTFFNSGYMDYLDESYVPIQQAVDTSEKPYWANIDS